METRDEIVRLVLELEPEGEAIAGTIASGNARSRRFEGMLELMSATTIDDPDVTADDNQWVASTLQTVSCDVSEVAISGGATVGGIGVGSESAVRESRPTASGDGWQISITSDEGGTNDYTPFAYCLDV